MSENEQGQPIESQSSPELTESSTEEVVEFDDTQEQPEQPTDTEAEKRKRTKSVSDRINDIRAESQREIDSLREQLEKANNSLYEYQANEEGISLEEFMARKQSEEERIQEAINNDPEVQRLRQSEFQRIKADTLSKLQDAYPDEGIEDIDHFPPDFYAMMRVGVDPVRAYRACVAEEKKSAPPSTGSTKSEGKTDSHTYTLEQIANMSAEEITADYDNVIASYNRLTK